MHFYLVWHLVWVLRLLFTLDSALGKLDAAPAGDARLAAAAEVASAGAPVADLAAALKKDRPAAEAEVRALLKKIGAEVPNAKGTFETPPRPRKPEAPEADLDWLAGLAKLPDTGTAETAALEVVALLRALALHREEAAADAILDFGFTPGGLVYRDECGRMLRKMAPWSFPTLLRASQDKKRADGAYARYATYQLDRLGKAVPAYALAAAPDEDSEVAMIHAIRDVKHPDAVSAILDRCDAPSHLVRRAAREAWMAYVTGPPPPPAPKQFRKLPGGKLSKKPEPLYLTYREFAENELRRLLLAQTGTAPPASAKATDMTAQLFEIYDRRRASLWDPQMKEAADAAAKKDWDAVGKRYDAILMADPTYARRGDMVPGYLALGRGLLEKKAFRPAVLAFEKAWSIDPTGAHAREAEALLYLARARDARASGRGDGEDDLARAQKIDPRVALTATSGAGGGGAAPGSTGAGGTAAPPARRSWLLWLGIVGAAAGVVLALAGRAGRARRRA
jgi:hypothetical protein